MPSRSSAWRRRALDRSAAVGAGPGRSGARSAPTVAAPAAPPPASRPDRVWARTERSGVTVTVSCWGGSSRTTWHGGGASRIRRAGRAGPSYTSQLHSHAVSQRRTGCSGTGRPPACGMSRNDGRRCSGLVGRGAGRGGQCDGAVRRHQAMGTGEAGARRIPEGTRSECVRESDAAHPDRSTSAVIPRPGHRRRLLSHQRLQGRGIYLRICWRADAAARAEFAVTTRQDRASAGAVCDGHEQQTVDFSAGAQDSERTDDAV